MAEERKSQRGANLTQADRERGGKVSAAKQERDARGKFAGTKGKRTQEEGQGGQRRDQEQQNQSGQSHHQQ